MASYTPVPLAFLTVDPEGGASAKPPVIFAHGLTGSKECWGEILQTVANATNRKVYAIDARNHGDSEWTDVFNFDANVDDLLHFMDTKQIPKAILCGHSMGGVTSIKTALRAPERVEKLIVEDMNVQKLPQEVFKISPMFFNLAKLALQSLPKGMDEETAKKTLYSFIVAQLPEEVKQFANPQSLEENLPMLLKRTEDGGYAFKANLNVLQLAMKNASTIMTGYTGVYEGPALFIYGHLSPFKVGLDEPNIKKLIPNAELVGLKTATHSVHTDEPKEFMEAVLKFLLKE